MGAAEIPYLVSMALTALLMSRIVHLSNDSTNSSTVTCAMVLSSYQLNALNVAAIAVASVSWRLIVIKNLYEAAGVDSFFLARAVRLACNPRRGSFNVAM